MILSPKIVLGLAVTALVFLCQVDTAFAQASCSSVLSNQKVQDPQILENFEKYEVPESFRERLKSSDLTLNHLAELVQNRMLPLLKRRALGTDLGAVYWFISQTNQGERYRVVVGMGAKTPKVLSVNPVTKGYEMEYYKGLTKNKEELYYEFKRPIMGQTFFAVEPWIVLKILDKHDLKIAHVIKAAENYRGRVRQSLAEDGFYENRYFLEGNIAGEKMMIIFGQKSEGSELFLVTAYLKSQYQ